MASSHTKMGYDSFLWWNFSYKLKHIAQSSIRTKLSMMRVCLTVWLYNQCNAIIACSYISQSIRTRSSGIASVRVPKILWIFSYRQMKKLTPIITSEIFNFLFNLRSKLHVSNQWMMGLHKVEEKLKWK